ncbi:MAG TPA: 5-formyltetrahydrofolate cyclo-ligase [Candidatus Omnitrophota bacterium]|nr:5-formyltetrahydrofolate cyclo-ligase [Candidatus Omnitrophota bacterium]
MFWESITYAVCHLTKKTVRERILTLLRNQKEEERLAKSLAVAGKLFKMKEFQKAETVLFYASIDGEVETFDMMKKAHQLGKTVGLPSILKDRKKIVPMAVASLEEGLEEGPYGIKQPKPAQTRVLDEEALDMVVVPGVAFDRKNNRLGRGGGYYDRFLKSLPSRTVTVGLAYDFQIMDSFPFQEKHDVSVSCVLSN